MNGLKFVLRFMERKDFLFISAALVSAFCLFAMSFAVPLVQASLIQNLTGSTSSGVFLQVGLLLSLSIAMCLATIVSAFVIASATTSINGKVEMVFLEKAIRLPFSLIKRNGSGWYQSAIMDDAEVICYVVNSAYISALFSVAHLPAAVLGLYGIVASLNYFASRGRAHYQGKYIAASTTAKSTFREVLENKRSIERNGVVEFFLERFRLVQETRRHNNVKSIRIGILSESLVTLAPTFLTVALVLMSMRELSSGVMGMSEIVLMFGYIPQLIFPIETISRVAMTEAYIGPAIQRFHTLESESSCRETSGFKIPTSADVPVVEFVGVISGNDTVMGFDVATESDKPLQSIDFQVSLGSRWSLIGISGVGKSSIVQIISGERRPAQGSVFVLGCELDSLPSPVRSVLINIYGQEVEIIDGTLEDNILLGRELVSREARDQTKALLRAVMLRCLCDLKTLLKEGDSYATIKRIQTRLKHPDCRSLRSVLGVGLESAVTYDWCRKIMVLVGGDSLESVADFLSEIECCRRLCLQDRYLELVTAAELGHLEGRTFGESGSRISGGERQRLALIRCLSREGWKALIVDEPFTSLDALSEEKLCQLLQNSVGDASLLLITHKLNLVPLLAPNVVFLMNGAVEQQGTHESLKTWNKGYRELWEAWETQRSRT